MHFCDLLKLYNFLNNQWKTPAEIKIIQERKLKKIIRHAYSNVPYYKNLFDSAGLKPKDIRNISDLGKIPLTSKKDIVDLPLSQIMAKNINISTCRKTLTSGTTGIPLKVNYRKKDYTILNFGWLRAYLAHGMKLWEKTGSFVGSKSNTSLKSWYERLGVLRKMILYSSDSPSKWMSALSHWKPQIITGYVMTLKLLASEISSHKQKNINPRLIFHSSGILDETSRTFISNVLGGKVIDIYGSDEGGCIAWECPKCNGYHINSDLLILELLTNGNAISKNTGEVVITNLHSYAMPLIRYKQGDVASFSDSTNLCKRGFPLLKNIQGRIDDFITLPSGRKISPHPFYWALLDIPEVSEWKIVQQQKDLLNIEIVVKNNTSSNNICTRISDNLNKILCNEMKIDIYSVQNIARNPNQKFRSVMSNLKEDMYT